MIKKGVLGEMSFCGNIFMFRLLSLSATPRQFSMTSEEIHELSLIY